MKSTPLRRMLLVLKAALNSILVYWISLYKTPAGVISEIEKIFRAFLWGREERGKKVNWIPWDVVCKSSSHGGLGLGHLAWKNKASLVKWAWRFGIEQKSLWRRIIVGKYKWDDRTLLLHSAMEEEGS